MLWGGAGGVLHLKKMKNLDFVIQAAAQHALHLLRSTTPWQHNTEEGMEKMCFQFPLIELMINLHMQNIKCFCFVFFVNVFV